MKDKPIPMFKPNGLGPNPTIELIKTIEKDKPIWNIELTKIPYEQNADPEIGWLDLDYYGLTFTTVKPSFDGMKILHPSSKKEKDYCLSYFLYPFELSPTDLMHPLNILERTPMEYIHNQIELVGIYDEMEDYVPLESGTVEVAASKEYWADGRCDGMLFIRDFETKGYIDKKQLSADIQCVKFCKEDKLYVGCGNGVLYILEIKEKKLQRFGKVFLEGECVMITKEGKCVTNNRGVIKLWSPCPEGYYEPCEIGKHDYGCRVECVKQVEDEDKYISGSSDGCLHIWEKSRDGEHIFGVSLSEQSIECIAVVKDGEYVAGGFDKYLYHIKKDGTKVGKIYIGHYIESVAIVPNNEGNNSNLIVCGVVRDDADKNGKTREFGVECVEITDKFCIVGYTEGKESDAIDIDERVKMNDDGGGVLFFINFDQITVYEDLEWLPVGKNTCHQ